MLKIANITSGIEDNSKITDGIFFVESHQAKELKRSYER